VTPDDLMQRAHLLAARWDLSLGSRFGETPGSPGNYVAAANRADRTQCVLKVSQHLRETRSEIAALRAFAGAGAARLLEADPIVGALLLERIEPGGMLADVALNDDDRATRIAANLLRKLWRPTADDPDLISLETWCAAYDRNRLALAAGVPGFPAELFRRADALREELLLSTEHPVLLHGDLHHFNILRSTRAEWLAIDPKGLYGDRSFDVCQFLRNPGPMPLAVNRRRVEIFCSELQLDPERTRSWCLVHAVLDACWSFEERDTRWPRRVAYAEEMLQL
jgi:streptomycin 6-kinase